MLTACLDHSSALGPGPPDLLGGGGVSDVSTLRVGGREVMVTVAGQSLSLFVQATRVDGGSGGIPVPYWRCVSRCGRHYCCGHAFVLVLKQGVEIEGGRVCPEDGVGGKSPQGPGPPPKLPQLPH